MREIKFRYRVKLPMTGRIAVVIKSLEEIESGVIFEYIKTQVHILSKDQFTGLKDKNGVEIYEGDIVEYFIRKMRCIGTISWATSGFWITGQLDRLNWVNYWKIVVIGNIYENPELLNGKS